ncbi:helix-turn-helix transcriptional regulator [Pseudoroseicyclus tamaricis]|uniref:LuxR family transcriptional regulator n=1 Tax=Pseudoroseicyclus tamaricis TaxID=2705421 RepID=A0A6B2JPM3_9RHOB|nr:autoinducer binding domain-containing protein [Pseudoroseicyclus tamaricis]NDU99904.1 LuxR family transcriptional regulator [Pseudoroseicyclus tamaricis]
MSLTTFLEELEAATGLDRMQELILALRDHYNVDHAIYHWVSPDGQQYGCGSYDRAWADRYFERDYIRIDPVIIGCFQRFHPVDWTRLDWSGRAARAFRADALRHGVGRQGYSVPIRGPNGQYAVFTISDNRDDAEWRALTAENRREWILLAHCFNQKALDLEGGRAPEPVRGLSPREVEALTFLAMGYARAQVADMLSISEHTLRAYIESARFKLSAINTVHAVARAIAEGLIVTSGAARDAPGSWAGRQLGVQQAASG